MRVSVSRLQVWVEIVDRRVSNQSRKIWGSEGFGMMFKDRISYIMDKEFGSMVI